MSVLFLWFLADKCIGRTWIRKTLQQIEIIQGCICPYEMNQLCFFQFFVKKIQAKVVAWQKFLRTSGSQLVNIP